MMPKIRQGLTIQHSSKHPGLVIGLFQGYQVLNLKGGNKKHDTLLWASILEDNKVSGIIGGWIIWIHEEIQPDPIRLFRIRAIYIFNILHIENKSNGGGVLVDRRMKRKGIF
jgi:hypothetical protein